MKYYVVDAFTEELFKGNPAGVCLVDEFPTDETMTNIAAENRLSETAFVKHKVDGIYRVRFSHLHQKQICVAMLHWVQGLSSQICGTG